MKKVRTMLKKTNILLTYIRPCFIKHYTLYAVKTKYFSIASPVTCGPPPLSGSVVYGPVNNSYLFKDTVVIQRCQGKLWFQGDQRLTCTADGTWNGTATCTPCKQIVCLFIRIEWPHSKASPF